MQTLILAEDVFDNLNKGKNTTIRNGRRDIALGPLMFESLHEKRNMIVTVHSVEYCRVIDVRTDDIVNDGFKNHLDMIKGLQRFYPDIKADSEVTVIKFFSEEL